MTCPFRDAKKCGKDCALYDSEYKQCSVAIIPTFLSTICINLDYIRSELDVLASKQ